MSDTTLSRTAPLAGQQHRPLGQHLLDLGLLTADQLDQALEQQKATYQRLGEVLVDLQFVTDTQIAFVLSKQLGLPLIDLNEEKIDPEVVRRVGPTFLNRHTVLPLREVNNKILLAM